MQGLEDAQSAEGAKHTARLRGFDFRIGRLCRGRFVAHADSLNPAKLTLDCRLVAVLSTQRFMRRTIDGRLSTSTPESVGDT